VEAADQCSASLVKARMPVPVKPGEFGLVDAGGDDPRLRPGAVARAAGLRESALGYDSEWSLRGSYMM